MLDRGVGGFLYACMYTRRATIPAELRGHRLVVVNCIARAAGIPMVVPDEFKPKRPPPRCYCRGHRDRIVLVGETPPDVIAARAMTHRDSGRCSAAMDWTSPRAIPTHWWPEPAYTQSAPNLQPVIDPPRSSASTTDREWVAYQAARDHGLRIPEQLSVVVRRLRHRHPSRPCIPNVDRPDTA